MKRLALALACGLATAAALAAAPGVLPDRIVLGQTAKLSGSGGTQIGRQYRDGLLLAFDATNRAGGVNGRRIELVTLDDQIDPARALANSRALIGQHQVFALVGSTFTNTVRAVLPLLRESGVPLVAPYTGAADLYAGRHPQVFMLRASFADELAALVRHIDTVGYERIALMHYANPLGEAFRQEAGAALAATGRPVMASAAMPLNPADPAAAVRPAVQALAASCPKVVVLGVSGRDAAALVRGLQGAGCAGVRYLARNLVDITLLQQQLGEAARGIMVTQVVPNPYRGAHPLVQDYRAQLRRREPAAQPDFTEFEGYIAGRFVVQALQRAGREPDRAGFVKALEASVLDGPERFRLQLGAGQRAASRYVNIVMVGERGRIAD